MSGDNPYGKHSFYDLDESWYRYMKADRNERKQMCEDMLESEGIVLFFCFLAVVIGGIVAVCKGWI